MATQGSSTLGSACIFFLSDYGYDDEFAGVVRAVLARAAPGAAVVDLTHGVPPFDVRAGALALGRCVPHLGPGVILAVVDPGVAGDRRGVALETNTRTGPRHLVGPDNGLLVWAAELLGGVESAVEIAARRIDGSAAPGGAAASARSTFDGRDVFAPAAARLFAGDPVCSLGEPLPREELVELPKPLTVLGPESLEAEVLGIDRFGNVQLSAGEPHLQAAGIEDVVVLEVSGEAVLARRVRSFDEVSGGEVGVIVDSARHVSLVVKEGSALERLGAGASARSTVVLRPAGTET